MLAPHRIFLCALIAAALAGCAGVPERPAATADAAPRANDAVAVRVGGALPFVQAAPGDEAFFASRANLSVNADWLAWDAEYAFEPGGILASNRDAAATSAPKRFAGQRVGQNLKLRLPSVAGAPVSFGIATEFRNQWTVDGYSVGRKSAADLRWSPGAADVTLTWNGSGKAYARTGALNCNIEGTVRLPVLAAAASAQNMTLSGSRCTVVADGTVYAGMQAETWGVGYAWQAPRQESSASLSVIRPEPAGGIPPQDLLTSYELGVSHRRDFGPLRATARIAMRRREPAGLAPLTIPADLARAQWVKRASLEWNLALARVAASWMQGANPLWFAPEFGTRRDSVGLDVDLSAFLGRYLPYARPELAFNWNWSETETAEDLVVGGNSLKVDVALLF